MAFGTQYWQRFADEDMHRIAAMEARVWGADRGTGEHLIREAAATPGDYIVLKAWIDLVIAISACPQEFNNAAGWYPTEILVEILEARVNGG